VFLGAVVLALVGTVSDLFAAVVFARQDNMDILFTICLGSAIQTALVVAPVLVLASWLIGQPMNLVFSSPLDLFAIAGAAFIVRSAIARPRGSRGFFWSGSICCSPSPTIL
jgi:Ca2+:H+ antiporter